MQSIQKLQQLFAVAGLAQGANANFSDSARQNGALRHGVEVGTDGPRLGSQHEQRWCFPDIFDSANFVPAIRVEH